eukprot:1748454-Rhodomonas_salina.1
MDREIKDRMSEPGPDREIKDRMSRFRYKLHLGSTYNRTHYDSYQLDPVGYQHDTHTSISPVPTRPTEYSSAVRTRPTQYTTGHSTAVQYEHGHHSPALATVLTTQRETAPSRRSQTYLPRSSSAGRAQSGSCSRSS